MVAVEQLGAADIQRPRKGDGEDMLRTNGPYLLLLSLPQMQDGPWYQQHVLPGMSRFSPPTEYCVSDYVSLDMYVFLFSQLFHFLTS